jgi:hypothetical protein
MNVREHRGVAPSSPGSVLAEAPLSAMWEGMVADHAGFAAAITVRERVLSDALLFAYSSASVARNLPIVFMGAGPTAPLVFLQAFLSPPTVTCDGARQALIVSVDVAGDLTFSNPSGAETHPIVGHVEISIPPVLMLAAGKVRLQPDHSDVKVITWTFTVSDGTVFKQDTDAYLRSATVRDRLSATVQWALDINLLPLPSVDVTSLGAVIDAAAPPASSVLGPHGQPLPVLVEYPVPARVVDGALVAGFNVENFTAPWSPPGQTGGITLNGDAFALEAFADPYDIAVITNPEALPIVLAGVEQQLVAAVGPDRTLASLTLSAGHDQFDVSGSITETAAVATFSFSIVPHMDAERPGGLINSPDNGSLHIKIKPISIAPRSYAGLWFSAVDPKIDISFDWTDAVLAALGFVLIEPGLIFLVPIAFFTIAQMLADAADEFRASVTSANAGAPVACVHHVTSSTLDNVLLRIALEKFSISPDGPFMGVTVTPKLSPPALVGPQAIPANLRTQALKYSVRLPIGVVADDPYLHIQWTVIDPANGTVHVNSDGLAKDRTSFTVTPEQVAPGLVGYDVGCRVYRTTGLATTDIFEDVVHLVVTPLRSSPVYVRWTVTTPRPTVGLDPTTGWHGGWHLANRRSTIHRLDRVNSPNDPRCQARASRGANLAYLDQLPFAIIDIDKHRHELCDYCFYGGPAGLRETL